MQGDQPPRSAAKRILIVEDNDLNLKLLCHILEAYGYQAITATQGGTGIALAREKQPDLILMDLQLPDISGLEAVRQLKQDPETAGIPIVAVTAFALEGDERRALQSGCDGYVPKPIAIREFIGTVERFVGAAR